MNTLQMRKCLKEGFTVEMLPDKLDMAIMSLRSIGVDCRVDGFEDLREKYLFLQRVRISLFGNANLYAE